jgi:hypothetical protein
MSQRQCPQCRSFKAIDKRMNYGWGGVALLLFSLPWIMIIIGMIPAIIGLAIAIIGFTSPAARRLKCRACAFEFPKSDSVVQLP